MKGWPIYERVGSDSLDRALAPANSEPAHSGKWRGSRDGGEVGPTAPCVQAGLDTPPLSTTTAGWRVKTLSGKRTWLEAADSRQAKLSQSERISQPSGAAPRCFHPLYDCARPYLRAEVTRTREEERACLGCMFLCRPGGPGAACQRPRPLKPPHGLRLRLLYTRRLLKLTNRNGILSSCIAR